MSYDFRPISHGFPGKQFVNENFHFSKFSIFILVLSITWGSNDNLSQMLKCSTCNSTPESVFLFSKRLYFWYNIWYTRGKKYEKHSRLLFIGWGNIITNPKSNYIIFELFVYNLYYIELNSFTRYYFIFLQKFKKYLKTS